MFTSYTEARFTLFKTKQQASVNSNNAYPLTLLGDKSKYCKTNDTGMKDFGLIYSY